MNKLDYLQLAIANNKYKDKRWVLSVITISDIPFSDSINPLDIFNDRQGYYTLYNNEKVRITDANINEPLFPISSKLTISNTIYPHLTSAITTTFGNLLFNLVCIHNSFGSKIPYINTAVNISKLERSIVKNMQDNPIKPEDRDPKTIYVDEYVKFGKGLQFLALMSQYITNSGGIKSILPPKNLNERKKELLQKYGDSINDPLVLVQFEKELLELDKEYLKDDPGYGKFVSGKIVDTSRKKIYLNMGIELGFDSNHPSKPIITSLSDGIPTDPEQFAIAVNGSRAGSYFRGVDTVNGGVSAKVLLRSISAYSVVKDKDGKITNCGSKVGHKVKISESNYSKYIGRYMLDKDNIVKITEEIAKSMVGKSISVRSPMYCRLEGDNLCEVCAGEGLSAYDKGLTIPATELSSTVLYTSMKKMHGTKLKSTSITLKELLS